METVARNAQQALVLHKTKRASDLTTRSRALEEIAEALDLDSAPLRIECFDISHLQGEDVVASMVVFEDGLPRKSEYRRFQIKGFEGQDDVPVHARGDQPPLQALPRREGPHGSGARRGARGRADGEVPRGRDRGPGPDREGGGGAGGRTTAGPSASPTRRSSSSSTAAQPQVAAARRALDELGIDDVAVCGLAKRLEEVWLPGDDDPVVLPRSSEGLYLLQRVRDTAHDFAIALPALQADETHPEQPAGRRPRPRGVAQTGLDQAFRLGEAAEAGDNRADL
ncbi:excinuclease ABC subunit UvrC [Streptomyces tanashiensis]